MCWSGPLIQNGNGKLLSCLIRFPSACLCVLVTVSTTTLLSDLLLLIDLSVLATESFHLIISFLPDFPLSPLLSIEAYLPGSCMAKPGSSCLLQFCEVLDILVHPLKVTNLF